MTTYTLSKARQKFSELVTAAQQQGAQFSITVNGKNAATILSQDDYESLLETLEILQEQTILQDLVVSEQEYKKGDIIPLDQL